MSRNIVKPFSSLLLHQSKCVLTVPTVRTFHQLPWHLREKKKKDLRWAAPLFEWKKKKVEYEDIEPSALHLVTKVKTLKGRPYWEKKICQLIGIGKDEPVNKKVVVKNTPWYNSQLEQIKHLVDIQPLTFPYGLPETPEDFHHCYIKDNGEFIVRKKIGDETMNRIVYDNLDIAKTKPECKWRMTKETLEKHVQKKLDDKDINAEYFRAKNVYKYNQDGKEYRYFGDKAYHGKGRNWF